MGITEILKIVEKESGFSLEQMTGFYRGHKKHSPAKCIAAQIMAEEGYSAIEIGKLFDMHPLHIPHLKSRAQYILSLSPNDAGYSLENKTLYLAVAKQVEDGESPCLEEIPSPSGLMLSDYPIIAAVTFVTGVPEDIIKSPSREKAHVQARDIAVALYMKYRPKLSLIQVGIIFNRRHTTIIFSRNKVEKLLESNGPFIRKYDMIEREFLSAERVAS